MRLPTLWRRGAVEKPGDRKATDDPLRYQRVNLQSSIGTNAYHKDLQAEQAMTHPIVSRMINKLAVSASTVKWCVEKTDDAHGRKATADQLRAIEALLAEPTDDLTPAEWIQWFVITRACYGVNFFKIGRSSKGYANGIYPLPSGRKIEAIINPKTGLIVGWRYRPNGGNGVEFPTRREAEKRDRPGNGGEAGVFHPYVARLRIPGLDIGDAIGCNAPIAALGLPAQITELLMQRAVDTASGHPNSRYIITASTLLTKDQADQFEDDLSEREVGGEASGNTLLIEGENVTVTKLDNDLSDIHSKMPLDDMTRQIAASLGIPMAMAGLGAADSSKFANNFDGSIRSFWKGTIIPVYLEPLAEGLTRAICPPGLRVRFDYDSIPDLEAEKAETAEKWSKVEFLSDDEKRSQAGFEKRETSADAE